MPQTRRSTGRRVKAGTGLWLRRSRAFARSRDALQSDAAGKKKIDSDMRWDAMPLAAWVVIDHYQDGRWFGPIHDEFLKELP